MNKLELWFMKRIARNAVRQGDQYRKVEEVFGVMLDACWEEYTEDNKPTIEAFLRDRLEEAFRKGP